MVEVLQAEFLGAARRIAELVQASRPELFVAVGVAPGSSEVRLERVARNRDAAEAPDISGAIHIDSTIVPGAPSTYLSTLPLLRMKAALDDVGVSTAISEDASGYVCNHLFYVARHEIERLGLPTRCGFIHVPLPGFLITG